ncbi:MAG: TIGR01244 family sulfur transferase [Caulobacter sp.]
MTDIRQVTPDFAVAPQLSPADMAQAAERGFVRVINNRPDGEAGDQPSSAEMEAAARAAGMDFVHIPVVGGPTPDQVRLQAEAIAEADGPVLAFCRSGTRSIVTWSLGQAATGARPRDELVQLGANAGYDLAPVLR